MSDAIVIDQLSKRYQIGSVHQDTTLRERIVGIFQAPFGRSRAESASIWALRDVSLTIKSGEVVGIIGRNGAGKSTLLKILSRITYPTSGTISVKGRVASLLEVGTGFHEELTGRENVFLNGSILGMTKKEVTARFDEIVEFAGVEKFIDTPIKRYSSGMRLRLGFAVAAHLDPDVLIVDEVLAVGDAGFQKKCLAIMGDLRTGGRTVLFVSHNMAAVENLCSRGLWIDEGRLREDGPARSVIQSYMNSFAGATQTEFDFGDVKNRQGSGEIRYTGVSFLSPDGQRQGVTRSGDEVVIRLSYLADRPITRPSFGFRLFTELGTLITETSTWHHAIAIPLLPAGAGVVDLKIESLNLMPARYYLSIWLTGEGGVVYDGLEHSAVLEVETANIYQAGRTWNSRYGIVFFPQRWIVNGVPVRGASEYDVLGSTPSGPPRQDS